MKFKQALLVVDMQNDFCPGGALGIKDGGIIIPAINKYIKYFSSRGLPIFATRDWHPKKTIHFKKFGGKWPEHCVRNTKGAEFHPDLKLTKEIVIMSKGMDPGQDSYSAFDSRDLNGMPFANLLKKLGVQELYIGGLATDYCVRFTALDALKAGLKVKILIDAIKGVQANDSKKALGEVTGLGAKKITLSELSIKSTNG
ncbi:MAG: nicotinamidase [Candidatus Omnitrophica bacterium]|nr:nicotinamidase [Candidatus Omnitrophota bacterium]